MLSRIARTLLTTTSQRNKPLFKLIPRQLSLQQQLQPDQQPQLNSPSIWLSECKKFVVLDDHQGQLSQSEFPLLWLRDNCQCSQCCHSEVNRRILDWSTFERPQELASLTFNETTVQLQWTDGHESSFDLDFFKTHKFDKASSEEYLRGGYRLPKVAWSKNTENFSMARYSLEEILYNPDGKEVKRWLTGLCQNGMGILENPKRGNRPDLMNEFIKSLFGFCKETHYGREFLIQNRITDITNIAYLNGNLQLHTDLPYYEYKPGVTVLHYLKQSTVGGLSTLVDGFQIAERMRQEEPEAFEILATVPVNFVDKGVENGLKFHKVFITPVIGLKNGQLDRISFSVPQRDSMFSVSDPKLVHKWYEAMQVFIRFSKEEVLQFKMVENDFLTFDNTRLLHGRTAYEANEQRTIVGCYVDWDEIYSKYRANEN